MPTPAESRYRAALDLYRDTELPVKEICLQTNTPEKAFRAYVRRCHRDLMFSRYGVDISAGEATGRRLRKPKGQSAATHAKYKEAILACDDSNYIEYNVSQIAYMFRLSPTGLNNQLHNHFPEILERREKERHRLGINDNLYRGARPTSVEQYADAVEHLRTTDDTISQTAERFNIPFPGLREYIIRYHKDITKKREEKRGQGKGRKEVGAMTGNGRIHQPSDQQNERYEKALHLYHTTAMTQKEIAEGTGVPLDGLRNYIRIWHRPLILERRGITPVDGQALPDLADTKHYLKSTAAKYAGPITKLKEGNLSIAEVAKEFGLNPESLRLYLNEHEPELASRLGKSRDANGRLVSNRSKEKYAEAIRIYGTTTETLKSIAERLGINYKSLSAFVRRNCPDAIAAHNRNIENELT